MATVVTSSLCNMQGKLSIDHVQNAVLAGGVAVGATADIIIHPYQAILIGILGGAASVMGFVFSPTFFIYKIKIHDSCGVHSLHAIPGLLGGVASICLAVTMNKADYGDNWGELFPAIKDGRSQVGQAIAQLATILTTLGIAIIGGAITGFVMKLAGRLQFGSDFVIPATDSFEDSFYILGEENMANIIEYSTTVGSVKNQELEGVNNEAFESEDGVAIM